jgi:hypothetical protein
MLAGVVVSLLAGHYLYSYAPLSVLINFFHLNNEFRCSLNLFC